MIWKQAPRKKNNWKVVWQIFSVIFEDGTWRKGGKCWEMSGQLSLVYLRRSLYLRDKLMVDIIHHVGPRKEDHSHEDITYCALFDPIMTVSGRKPKDQGLFHENSLQLTEALFPADTARKKLWSAVKKVPIGKKKTKK